MSAGSLIETRIVAFGKGGETLLQAVNKNIAEIPIDIMAVTPSQADRADAPFRIYGRGTRHPANLNIGDCFTYALAAEMDEPILCKGDDVIHTDRAIFPARNITIPRRHAGRCAWRDGSSHPPA
jgi:ribonuclease VapC